MIALALVGLLSPAPITPFPDLSDPKSAAYSMAVAIEKMNDKGARTAYAGDDAEFLKYLNTMSKARTASERVQRAYVARFGEEWQKMTGLSLDSKWEMQVDGRGDKVPVTVVIALTEVKQDSDNATLHLTKDIEIRLKKVSGEWKVTKWPGPAPFAEFNLELGEAVLKQIATDLEQGKYTKPIDAALGFYRTRDKVTLDFLKK